MNAPALIAHNLPTATGSYLGYRVNLSLLSSTDQSRAAEQIALKLDSEAFYAWLMLGRCQQDLGFIDAARISFERCLELVRATSRRVIDYRIWEVVRGRLRYAAGLGAVEPNNRLNRQLR